MLFLEFLEKYKSEIRSRYPKNRTYSLSQNLTLRSVESSVIEFSEQGERPSDP
ncbi:hypothetical protein [Leptospira santarosai]|uniref:hypothetical protein n=1 Tax=Leptospira santarosai TaxID=28183 RepID=UPI0012BA8DA3|nr:hypothetical protein [Leptospira santarosai]